MFKRKVLHKWVNVHHCVVVAVLESPMLRKHPHDPNVGPVGSRMPCWVNWALPLKTWHIISIHISHGQQSSFKNRIPYTACTIQHLEEGDHPSTTKESLNEFESSMILGGGYDLPVDFWYVWHWRPWCDWKPLSWVAASCAIPMWHCKRRLLVPFFFTMGQWRVWKGFHGTWR